MGNCRSEASSSEAKFSTSQSAALNEDGTKLIKRSRYVVSIDDDNRGNNLKAGRNTSANASINLSESSGIIDDIEADVAGKGLLGDIVDSLSILSTQVAEVKACAVRLQHKELGDSALQIASSLSSLFPPSGNESLQNTTVNIVDKTGNESMQSTKVKMVEMVDSKVRTSVPEHSSDKEDDSGNDEGEIVIKPNVLQADPRDQCLKIYVEDEVSTVETNHDGETNEDRINVDSDHAWSHGNDHLNDTFRKLKVLPGECRDVSRNLNTIVDDENVSTSVEINYEKKANKNDDHKVLDHCSSKILDSMNDQLDDSFRITKDIRAECRDESKDVGINFDDEKVPTYETHHKEDTDEGNDRTALDHFKREKIESCNNELNDTYRIPKVLQEECRDEFKALCISVDDEHVSVTGTHHKKEVDGSIDHISFDHCKSEVIESGNDLPNDSFVEEKGVQESCDECNDLCTNADNKKISVTQTNHKEVGDVNNDNTVLDRFKSEAVDSGNDQLKDSFRIMRGLQAECHDESKHSWISVGDEKLSVMETHHKEEGHEDNNPKMLDFFKSEKIESGNDQLEGKGLQGECRDERKHVFINDDDEKVVVAETNHKEDSSEDNDHQILDKLKSDVIGSRDDQLNDSFKKLKGLCRDESKDSWINVDDEKVSITNTNNKDNINEDYCHTISDLCKVGEGGKDQANKENMKLDPLQGGSRDENNDSWIKFEDEKNSWAKANEAEEDNGYRVARLMKLKVLNGGFYFGNTISSINLDQVETSHTDDANDGNVEKGPKNANKNCYDNGDDQCTIKSSHTTETEAEMLREITENDDNTSIYTDDSISKLIELCDEESASESIEYYGEESVSEDLRGVISPQFERIQLIVNDSGRTTPIADDSLSLLDDIPSPTCSLDSHLADSLSSEKEQTTDSPHIPNILNISHDSITPLCSPSSLIERKPLGTQDVDEMCALEKDNTEHQLTNSFKGSARKSKLVRPSAKTLLKSTIEQLLSMSSITDAKLSSLPGLSPPALELQFVEKKLEKSTVYVSPQSEMGIKSDKSTYQPISHVALSWSRKSKLVRPSTKDLLCLGRRRSQQRQFEKLSFTSKIPLFHNTSMIVSQLPDRTTYNQNILS